MKQKLGFSPENKQIQQLILSPQMQQALHLLQLPIMELEAAIFEELVQNPLLESENFMPEIQPRTTLSEREENDHKSFIENKLSYATSLYDHLMGQASLVLKEKELTLAHFLIGNLDHRGFLSSSLEEIAESASCDVLELQEILKVIQTFTPLGVGAYHLQDSLLIQLRAEGKEKSLAYEIIEKHFEDLLKNRIPLLVKKLGRTASQIYEEINSSIISLNLSPGSLYGSGHYEEPDLQLTPDLHINYIEGKFAIEVNEAPLPPLRFNPSYLEMLEDRSLDQETRSYLEEKLSSGKWLMRNLKQRHHTLRRIGEKIIETQNRYLIDPKGELKPMTMKEIAAMLELHESTIARAISGKYLSCPRGILPLREFFTNAYITDSGEEISSQTVKESLRAIVAKEDKSSPLSDEKISQIIKDLGIPCARRTVAKYRGELGIGNTTQRKKHS